MKIQLLSLALLVLSLASLRAEEEKAPYAGDVRVKTLLKTTTNSAGQTIVYPSKSPAEVSILTVEIAPGKQTGWHKHPVPLFGYVLEGEITVQLANGRKHTFHQGSPLAECVNMLHNGTNEGKVPTKLLVFIAGEKDVPFTIKVKTADSSKK